MPRSKINIAKITCVLILTSMFKGCIEPIDFTIPNRKNLVVEALLTDELKRHEVLLSRAYRFENDSIAMENGATVSVVDERQNEYIFNETEVGRYVSNIEFAAEMGVGYTLLISTKDGKTYRSKVERFNGLASINDILAERTNNSTGDDGLLISVDGSGGDSEFFRYTYEETYKIVAPKYIGLDFKLSNYDPCSFPLIYDLEIVPREEQQQICYGYRQSNQIIQASISQQSNNSLTAYPVAFITSDDFVLSYRYSILVKQYVQSADAYSYYNTLKDISTSENLFSDIQPGFLEGNIIADDDEDRLVLGLFEVSSVSSKRLFFNYGDFYPDTPLPEYPVDCENNFIQPELEHDVLCNDDADFPHSDCGRSLLEYISENLVAYATDVPGPYGECEGPYKVVPRVCGDCTLLGSNIVPDFWIE